ncbi:MAG: VRR-NUC domain-containing protein [Desulfobacteraceae bacterium]|nr:VRR-NUC domain-containing protein [Desulfobacteraceae bacterium]
MQRKYFLRKHKSKWHYGLEKYLVRRISIWLRKEGIWHFKVHGSAFQVAGIPDIISVVNGHAVFIEVKTASGSLSKIQRHVIGKIRKAGASVNVVRCLEEVQDLIEIIRREGKNGDEEG